MILMTAREASRHCFPFGASRRPTTQGDERGVMDWKEQYKHPNWQKRRLERLEDSGWACGHCGCESEQLHVHHKLYVRGRNIWEYENHELEVLCHECHTLTHQVKDQLNEAIARCDLYSLKQLLGYARAISYEPDEFIFCDDDSDALGIADALGYKSWEDVIKLTKNGLFPIAEIHRERMRKALLKHKKARGEDA